jgi:clathrin heavy chain
VGRLLDVDCDETTINGLLASVMGNFPIDELVREVGQRNRLMLILPSLAARLGHDPYLAYIAYAKGFCDVLSRCSAASTLSVKCRQPELWAQVLVSDNLHRRQLIDQVRCYYLFLVHLLINLADLYGSA